MPRCSDVLIRTLIDLGITKIVGIPGGETLPIMDAIMLSDMEFICVREENAAAFMALTESRLSGKPGVCLTTVGPGAANILLGVSTAHLDRVPMIVLTGEFSLRIRSEPHRQSLAQNNIFTNITKYSREISDIAEVESAVRKAYDDCMCEPAGPVHLSLPMDVMGASSGSQLSYLNVRTGLTSPNENLSLLREELKNSQRPVIICGQGVLRSGAGEELRLLSTAWNIPVAHTWMGDGVVPFDSPLSLHRIGLPQNLVVQGLAKSDLILSIGLDIAELHPAIWEKISSVPVRHLTSYPQNMSPRHPNQKMLVCDLSAAMRDLRQTAMIKMPWWEDLRSSLHNRIFQESTPTTDGIHPRDVVRLLRSHLQAQDIVISDVGAHMLWLCDLYPTYAENTLLISNGMIPMGIGLPGSIGAQLAKPERKVVNVSGDGGFQMCMAELGTALQLSLPVLSLVWNDHSLGLIKTRHEMAYGRHCGTKIPAPDFATIAESYGAIGYRANTVEELDRALRDALCSTLPVVIDIRVDPRDNYLLFQ